MNKKILMSLKIIFLICILINGTFISCSAKEQKIDISQAGSSIEIKKDLSSILPDWADGEYHDYYMAREKLIDFNDNFSSLVSVFSIGKSVLNKDIWCIRITNENNNGKKYSCLYDGCTHGDEWESGEACLYFAEYLLINFGKNETITALLNKSEIYIVPIVNPDGRQSNDRYNYNGIDLNRNFDVHFGRILGGSLPLGKIFGLKLIKCIFVPFPPYFITNSGRHPFTEPESRAVRDLMRELKYNDFSFYLSLHTSAHTFGSPSDKIIRSEYEISPREIDVLDYSKSWVENNTEYRSAKDKNRFGYGSSYSYCFKECHIPSFSLEVLNPDYQKKIIHGRPHDHLVHWMNTTLPIFMYLLVNIENLHNWNTPDIEPLLPEGVPPEPLQ